MVEPHGSPGHPERQHTVHGAAGPGPAHVSIAWLLVLVGAGTAGVIAAAVSENGGMFASPWLPLTFGVFTVLSGLAGWFVPAGGLYWGLVPAAPYLIGFLVQVGRHPAAPPEDADFGPLGFFIVLVLTAIPWGIGYAASLIRRSV